MYVRLGFAISTQFTPDVLLVDEVFGAGDAAFARRAQARIRHLTANAGILVLVSHDFGAILENCTRVIWMDRGKIIADGDPQEVVSNYLSTTAAAPEAEKE
jgi:ABC-type polysaccharide/polyol phosphate transport system ATPase subunit